jgi:Flp pilus assembly protein protease CpaA
MYEKIIFTLSVLLSLSLYVKMFLTVKWNEREYFQPLKPHWNKIIIGSFIMTVLVGSGLYYLVNLPLIHFVPLMILVFVLFFSAWTDFKTAHAPSELAWAGIWLSVPFMLTGFITGGIFFPMFLTVLFWGLVCFLLYFNRGLGDADVRLLWLINISTLWWVGLYWSVLLFSFAAVIQLVIHFVAQVFNWGSLREMKYSKLDLKIREILSNVFKNINLTKTVKTRRHVPFIPALTIGWIIGLSLLLVFIPEYVNVLNFGLVSL